jgi:hypothetical protein
MAYDYLWNADEIANGNGHIIRNLLKQIKTAYKNESEYLQGMKQ